MLKKNIFLLVSFISMTLLFAACSEATKEDHHDEDHTAQTEEAEKMVYPEDSLSADGMMSYHGLRIDGQNALPIVRVSEMMPAGSDEQTVKLEGEIQACCQAKGCWMTLKLDDENDMRVTFRDYGFFVPKDAAGKTAVVEGRVFYDTTSVETLRHFAVDGGMTEEEAEKKYTEPKVELSFEATGVIIKG